MSKSAAIVPVLVFIALFIVFLGHSAVRSETRAGRSSLSPAHPGSFPPTTSGVINKPPNRRATESSAPPTTRRPPPPPHRPTMMPFNPTNFSWLPFDAKAMYGKVDVDGDALDWAVLSVSSPRAYVIRGLLSRRQCDDIIAEANSSLEPSLVINLNSGLTENKRGSYRTSHGVFLQTPTQEQLPANQAFRRRTEQLIGIPVDNWGEKTQVLRYDPGEYYKPHEDYFSPMDQVNMVRGGQRIITVVLYLNQISPNRTGLMPFEPGYVPTAAPDTAGGETAFPRTKHGALAFKPNQGDAIVFYDVKEDGSVDPASLHEGRPPMPGYQKWIGVLWFHGRTFT